MTKEQNIIESLLKELKEICVANDIKYVLHGSTAAKAIVTGSCDTPFAQICISSRDFRKFIEVVEKNMPEGRKLDYMGNNKNYKSFSAKYYDVNTSYIPLNQNKNYYVSGMFVEIIVSRQIIPDKMKKNVLNTLEHGWESNFRHLGIIRDKRYVYATFLVFILKILLFGRANVGKFIFNKLLEAYEKPYDTEFYNKEYFKKIVKFDFDPLERTRDVYLFGDLYQIPVRYGTYLNLTYSLNWKKTALNPVNNVGRVVSCEIPYDEMLKNLESKGFSLRKCARLYNKKHKDQSRHIKYDYLVKDVWSLAKRTGDRIELQEYYEPKMDLIRKLYEDKNYHDLTKLMKKHRRVMVKHLNLGIGFAVNKELFDIQMELFTLEGKSEIVTIMKRLTPKEYMKNVF